MVTVSHAVAKVPIAHPDRLYIGGAWVKPSSDERRRKL
jgi:hypothetical protein